MMYSNASGRGLVNPNVSETAVQDNVFNHLKFETVCEKYHKINLIKVDGNQIRATYSIIKTVQEDMHLHVEGVGAAQLKGKKNRTAERNMEIC